MWKRGAAQCWPGGAPSKQACELKKAPAGMSRRRLFCDESAALGAPNTRRSDKQVCDHRGVSDVLVWHSGQFELPVQALKIAGLSGFDADED